MIGQVLPQLLHHPAVSAPVCVEEDEGPDHVTQPVLEVVSVKNHHSLVIIILACVVSQSSDELSQLSECSWFSVFLDLLTIPDTLV